MAKDISIEAATSASAPSWLQRNTCATASCVSRTQHSIEPPCVFNRSVMRGRGASSALAHAACKAASTAFTVLPASKCSVSAAMRRSVSSLGVGLAAVRADIVVVFRGGPRTAHGVDSALWSTVFAAPRWRPGVALRGRGGDRASGRRSRKPLRV